MSNRIEKVVYNPVGYTGDIIAFQQSDDSYDVVFGTYTVNVKDLDDPVEIINDSYRIGFDYQYGEDMIEFVAYVEPPHPPEETQYAIWNIVEDSKKLPCCEPPTGIDFTGTPDLISKPHMMTWVKEGHGLILQKIFYQFYDPITKIATRPLVRVRYHWFLEPESNFVIKRDEIIEYYSEDADELGNYPILPYTKVWTKYYDTAMKQIEEIVRRRKNVVSFLKDSVISMIAVTETAANPLAPTALEIKTAIELGQAYLDHVAVEINMFVENGTDTLASKTLGEEAADPAHNWLNNTLELFGATGVTIAQYIANEIVTDTSDIIDNFDWSTLPIQ